MGLSGATPFRFEGAGGRRRDSGLTGGERLKSNGGEPTSKKKETKEIIEDVTGAVEQWRQIAKNVQIPMIEQERFSERFNWGLLQARTMFPKKQIHNVPAVPKKGKGGLHL